MGEESKEEGGYGTRQQQNRRLKKTDAAGTSGRMPKKS